jgi:hypothetical protein
MGDFLVLCDDVVRVNYNGCGIEFSDLHDAVSNYGSTPANNPEKMA